MNNWYQSIPKKMKDWTVEVKDKTFNRETIFKYINGGAELYLSFDFKQVFVREFTGPGRKKITLDIYDMGHSEEAFGIFSSEREDKTVGVGQDSEYSHGLLRFWKDRYFISILAIGNDPGTREIILKLGNTVASAIPSTGQPPELLKYLPQEKLDKKRIRYFHSDIVLNNQYYIANENILNLNRDTNCILAEYATCSQDPGIFLMAQYNNKKRARIAYELFLKTYMPEAIHTGSARMENKKWAMVKINKNLIKIVFEAPDQKWASVLLSKVSSGNWP